MRFAIQLRIRARYDRARIFEHRRSGTVALSHFDPCFLGEEKEKVRQTANGAIGVLTEADGLVLGHQLAGEVFILSLHHAGNAEEIDQHPEAETADH